MTVGVSASAAAAMLNTLGDPYIQMHFGDPGDDGTSNVAVMSTRQLVDLTTATTVAARTLTSQTEWAAAWSGGSQTVTHLSAWSASTGGSFLFSLVLASQIDFTNGMIPRLTALSVSVPSVATD